IFAVLVRQPRSAFWDANVWAVYHAIAAKAAAATFPSEMYKHRRNLYAVLNVGLAYGKGQRMPACLCQTQYNTLLDRLLSNPAVQCMATFASATFRLWAPHLYKHYHKHNTALHNCLPHLRRNFPRSVFACATFNFGPNVWTFRHRDVLNLPFGWCMIQSSSPFDATKDGHLVLWDLKIAVEFPHGALILVPSAMLSHSNVPVQPGNECILFMQFTSGGLMQFVDHRFQTELELAE
ncbi:hypothetical protein B0H17DRAFT_903059, partial [Mycena rosella]